MTGDDDRVLHVVWSPFDDIAHVVGPATMAAARAEDESPVVVDFGDLRRSGDVDELAWRLEQNGYGSLEDYVSAIEELAGLTPASDDVVARLMAVKDIDFGGRASADPEADGVPDLPVDTELFLSESEEEEEPDPEFRGYAVIAQAMSSDIPADLFEKYAASRHGDSPAFSGHIDDGVSSDQLPALIEELRARGFTVIED